jgi:hypothetical protein
MQRNVTFRAFAFYIIGCACFFCAGNVRRQTDGARDRMDETTGVDERDLLLDHTV